MKERRDQSARNLQFTRRMFDDVVARGADPERVRVIIRDGTIRTAGDGLGMGKMAALVAHLDARKN